MKKVICLVLALALLASVVCVFAGCDKELPQYTSDGRMILYLRNLYFNNWTGEDAYTDEIEDKFQVEFKPTSYSWADWDQQVSQSINGTNLTDVFHFDLDSYNYTNSYKAWVDGGMIKALPDDLSDWPNIKSLIEGINNIDALKYKGKLYCIPVAKNIAAAETEYSPFTYVYRRDWAKKYGVYQENDEYTWEQFCNLVETFSKKIGTPGDFAAIADVEWGFPSLINFFKTAPHCYAVDTSTGKVVSNYATTEFKEGMDLSKTWVSKKYYGLEQSALNDGDANKKYYSGRVGVFYENLSLSNYTTLRKEMKTLNKKNLNFNIDDATAIMKVKGPDGKYVLEGTDNWFSATFFNADISTEKFHKILDIMDWLLGEEGTRMATYGIEGYDYTVDAGGNIVLGEGWTKSDGEYLEKMNGAQYLRYMCTLGYDTNDYNPMVNQEAYAILKDWTTFMNTQLANGDLRILKEDKDVKWLSTPTKGTSSGKLLENANAYVMQYVYGKIGASKYNDYVTDSTWSKVLKEINTALGK